MPLLAGSTLTPRQQAQVCSAFVHRWTVENARQTYQGRCPACAQGAPTGMTEPQWHAHHMPLTTDAEWIAAHAFYFVKDGSRLAANRPRCEPAYMAGCA